MGPNKLCARLEQTVGKLAGGAGGRNLSPATHNAPTGFPKTMDALKLMSGKTYSRYPRAGQGSISYY